MIYNDFQYRDANNQILHGFPVYNKDHVTNIKYIICFVTIVEWYIPYIIIHFSFYTFLTYFLFIYFLLLIYLSIVDGKRSLMVVKRSPGPYEDRYGPIVIGSLFVFAFSAQYCIMMAKTFY